MKALVFDGGLHYQADYPVPRPKQNEALIRVTHAGICNTDLEIVKGYMGFQGIPGHEFVGIVERCGEKTLRGKRVAGEINIGCNKCSYCRNNNQNHCPDRAVLGILKKNGAFAEYVTIPVGNLHLLPDAVSDHEAVFIEPLAAAFEILKQVKITRSDNVCVLGDGKLGLLVAQVIAATECSLIVAGKHKEKLNILEEMGIKTVLQFNPLPLRKRENQFDIVIDCTGSPHGIKTALDIVRPGGKIVLKTTVAESVSLDVNRFVIKEITLIGSRCGPFPSAIKAITAKKVCLDRLVAAEFRLEEGLKAFDFASKGALKVILRMS